MKKTTNESNESLISTEYMDEQTIKAYQKLLNLRFRNFDWFYEIEVEELAVSKKYMTIEAVMYIDEL